MPTPGVHLATGVLASYTSLTGQLSEPRSPYCPGPGDGGADGHPIGASRFASQLLAALSTPPLYLSSKGSARSRARCQGNVLCLHPCH